MAVIRSLAEVDYSKIGLVGGKAASLGEMINAGISVPPGFVITTRAYAQGMTQKLEEEILAAFDELGSERVAVRSSAVAEDSGGASWAGQLETYLNTKRGGLIKAVKQCWASMESDHATEYAYQHGVSKADRAVAVIVQKMIDSDISGVLFTANPVTENREEIVIETTYGLGELLVQGMVTPENVRIEKSTGKILHRQPSKQRTMLIYKNGKNQEVPVPTSSLKKPVVSDKQVSELVKLARKIENHYGTPQDIEWAIAGNKPYILQSRPITTLSPPAARTIQLAKLFSREKGVWYLHVWDECDRKTFAKYLNYQVKNSLYLREGVKMSVWFDLNERDAVNKLLKAKLKDKTFIPSLLKELEHEWVHLGPYLTGKQHVQSTDDLRNYYKHLIAWWLPMTIIFGLPQAGVTVLDPEALGARETAEKYSDTMDNVWDTFWEKQPAKYGKLMHLMTPDEAFNFRGLDTKKLGDIAGRSAGIGLLNNKLYAIDQIGKALDKSGLTLAQEELPEGEISEITGETAFRGMAEGRIRLIVSKKEIPLLQDGEIIVTEMTSPKFVPAISRASAVVTDEGGVTCHAAIAARETKTPCVIGTGIATKVLKTGDLVRVDANRGIVTIISKEK